MEGWKEGGNPSPSIPLPPTHPSSRGKPGNQLVLYYGKSFGTEPEWRGDWFSEMTVNRGLTVFINSLYSIVACNCKHYRTKFYFGFQCINKVIIIYVVSDVALTHLW